MRLVATQDELCKRLRYENGALYWLPRGYGKFDKQFAEKEAGGMTPRGYKTIAYNNGHLLNHHAVWIMHNGDMPENMEIDHINGNPLDNRIENLRLASRSQNAFNTSLRKDNKSGVKGVNWNKANNNWRARITVNKKEIEIGSYETIEEAKLAIAAARIKYHGDYANFGYREAA